MVVVTHLSLLFVSPTTSAPCSAGTITLNVGSESDLQAMTNTINCTGEGVFDVEWIGNLQLQQKIFLSGSKNLTITGSSARLPGVPGDGMDAGNVTGIFAVSGGSTLRLQNLVLKGGFAEIGGGIDVRSSSVVHVNGCSFTNNVASTGGVTCMGR